MLSLNWGARIKNHNQGRQGWLRQKSNKPTGFGMLGVSLGYLPNHVFQQAWISLGLGLEGEQQAAFGKPQVLQRAEGRGRKTEA